MKYLCTTKCYHSGHLYEVGQVVEFDKEYQPPKDKEGKVRHFEAVGKHVDEVDAVDQVDKGAKDSKDRKDSKEKAAA